MNEEIRERDTKLVTSNRRAEHDYFIMKRYEAGIQLVGTEVKSLRDGKCSLQEAYAGFKNNNFNELFIFNMHINEYRHGNQMNHNPKREKKLLLKEREIAKLRKEIQEKGNTIIPLQIYFSGPWAKVEIGLARAKKKYDKRESTKAKEVKRELNRKFKV
jgi:SsrA-binding protein